MRRIVLHHHLHARQTKLLIGVDGIASRRIPMNDTDIVTWLRSILHNDRSVELRCQEAANEIERLRDELEDTKIQLANMEEDYFRIRDHNE